MLGSYIEWTSHYSPNFINAIAVTKPGYQTKKYVLFHGAISGGSRGGSVVISDVEVTKGPCLRKEHPGNPLKRTNFHLAYCPFIAAQTSIFPLKCCFNSPQCLLLGFTLIGRLLL